VAEQKKPTFELFDHTADVGVRVEAASRAELVPAAVDGLYAVIGEMVVADATPPQPRSFTVNGSEPVLLLRDFLSDILYLFDNEHQRLENVMVQEFEDNRLTVLAVAREIDVMKSRLEREVKAITYHELGLHEAADGCQATYIVDI